MGRPRKTLPYKEIPKEGRIPCKVSNLELPGEDIIAGINGVSFTIQDGQLVELHPSQIEVLKNAIIETYEQRENDAGGFVTVGVRRPRFYVDIQAVTPPKVENIPTTEGVHTGRG